MSNPTDIRLWLNLITSHLLVFFFFATAAQHKVKHIPKPKWEYDMESNKSCIPLPLDNKFMWSADMFILYSVFFF